MFESVCQSGSELVGLHQGDISVLELDGRNAKPHRIADRVNQLTCGDKPLFSSGNKLFYIDDQQAYLAFSSSRLNMSNIWSIGDRLGFNVFVATTPGRASDGVSHAYTIDLKTDHSGQRIEDFLPYLSDGTLPFFEMDYNDSVIYIQPSFTGISNHRTGRFSVDQNSFNDSKGIMESKLKSDGIDKFDRRVIFTTGQ